MKYADTDTTYCTNEECQNKCWRHESNYIFKENENYWYHTGCIDMSKGLE